MSGVGDAIVENARVAHRLELAVRWRRVHGVGCVIVE